MTDIQRALLGDHDAAARLTEQGVLIPCPCCKGEAVLAYSLGPYYMLSVRVKCKSCGHQTVPAYYGNNGTIKFEEANEHGKDEAEQLVTRRWNTRAPLVTQEQMEMLDVMESHAESEALTGKQFGQAKPYWEYREPQVINCEKLEREKEQHGETAEKAQDHGRAMEDQML